MKSQLKCDWRCDGTHSSESKTGTHPRAEVRVIYNKTIVVNDERIAMNTQL